MLYNLAQSPISDGLREYLLSQVPDTPPQEFIDLIKTKLDESKLGEWYQKINIVYHKSASVDDIMSLYHKPQFYVLWTASASDAKEMTPPDLVRALLIIGNAHHKQTVLPPEKISVLQGFSEKSYSQPANRFYCLPKEVVSLRLEAIKKAEKPFEDVKVIDFSQETSPETFEEKFSSAAEALNSAIGELPPVPNAPGDSIAP